MAKAQAVVYLYEYKSIFSSVQSVAENVQSSTLLDEESTFKRKIARFK